MRDGAGTTQPAGTPAAKAPAAVKRPRWAIAQNPLYGFAMGGIYLFIGLGSLALTFVGASPGHTTWRIIGVLRLVVAGRRQRVRARAEPFFRRAPSMSARSPSA
jgi:hypothetical protein